MLGPRPRAQERLTSAMALVISGPVASPRRSASSLYNDKNDAALRKPLALSDAPRHLIFRTLIGATLSDHCASICSTHRRR